MIIPVLDIKGGKAVSGQSGKRDTYQELKTIFHDSSDPENIARAIKKDDASRIYIADLDSIEKKGSNLELIARINQIIPVMLDCGACDLETVKKAFESATNVIVATETLKSRSDLFEIFQSEDRDKIVLSVDVKDGKILSKHMDLEFEEVTGLIDQIQPKETILLDISKVGTLGGINKDLISKFRKLRTSLIIGGGIKGEEIPLIHDMGVDEILVGSALHSGKLKL
ncbi:MAG TPA: HisA/HisF family protein [Methanobacteriaceae archaeon]|nr:HisA/HisF family protein [Methanobacteriaceae archaeon]